MYQRTSPWIYVLGILFVLLIIVIVMVMRASKKLAPATLEENTQTEVSDKTAQPPSVTAPSDQTTISAGFASVDTLDVRILESFPVQVTVSVQGNLADPCVTLGSVTSAYSAQSKTFTLALPIFRPADTTIMCAAVLVPYNRTVPLNVQNLSAGTYTVIAGDIKKTFTLDTDNTLNISDGK